MSQEICEFYSLFLFFSTQTRSLGRNCTDWCCDLVRRSVYLVVVPFASSGQYLGLSLLYCYHAADTLLSQ